MSSGSVTNSDNKKMSGFLKCFSDEYERVYIINMENGSYTLTYFNDTNYTAPYNGDYRSGFERLVNTHVSEPYRDEFIRLFCFDNLKRTYSENFDSRLTLRYVGSSAVGRDSWKKVLSKAYINPDTNELNIVCMIKDISDEKMYGELCTQNALLKSEIDYRKKLDAQNERFEIIVRQTDADVIEWTKPNGYIYISSRLADRFYISPDSHGLLSNVIHPDDSKIYWAFKRKIEENSPMCEVICRAMQKNGEYIWVKISSSNFYDDNGEICRIVASVLDVNDRMCAYKDLNYRANHDKLTGLSNKEGFYKDAQAYMSENPGESYAVIMLDIDKFRLINDVYGSKTGDNVLCYMAEGVEKAVRCGLVCRMYSDNFAIFVSYESEEEIDTLMNNIIAYSKTYPLDINIVISYGVYKVEDISLPVSIMCDRAGYAKKTIKGNTLKLGVYYDGALRENMLEDKMIENEMEYALEHDQFRLYLQPKVDILTSKVIGAEALVRWIHPTKGLILPARFIPLFERNSFIIRMDIYMWEQVCRLIRRWIDEGKTPVPISINISRLHIVDPTLKNTLISLTNKYKIPHSLIEIEITETAFMGNVSTVGKCIADLKSLGFTVSIDDFGSGYSSLNMLKEVSVDALKIDRGFLNEVVATQKGKIIISHTIAMANELNLNVVSEGVETVEQAEFLLKCGCRTAQGFLYSKPLSIQNYEMYAYNTKSHNPIPFHIKHSLRFN